MRVARSPGANKEPNARADHEHISTCKICNPHFVEYVTC